MVSREGRFHARSAPANVALRKSDRQSRPRTNSTHAVPLGRTDHSSWWSSGDWQWAQGLSFAGLTRSFGKDAGERFDVAHRVVHGVMVMLGDPEPLPLRGSSEVADEPRVEVPDPSGGVPEGILARSSGGSRS